MTDNQKHALERLDQADKDAETLSHLVSAIQRSLQRLRAQMHSERAANWSYGALTFPLRQFVIDDAAEALQELIDELALSALGDDRAASQESL